MTDLLHHWRKNFVPLAWVLDTSLILGLRVLRCHRHLVEKHLAKFGLLLLKLCQFGDVRGDRFIAAGFLGCQKLLRA